MFVSELIHVNLHIYVGEIIRVGKKAEPYNIPRYIITERNYNIILMNFWTVPRNNVNETVGEE